MKPFVIVLGLLGFLACQASRDSEKVVLEDNSGMEVQNDSIMDTATFGAGCFWCVEAVFQDLKGVHAVTSGYMGGKIANPTYREVCSGLTGHAEVIQLVYDSNIISYDELLEVFWQTHDPTTLNQQGADKGTQYRSAVFYHNDYQKERATYFKNKLNAELTFGAPVVTEISPAAPFYKAEDYHQEYYNNNSSEGYCRVVIKPKLDKLKKVFGDKLKTSPE
ncbi:MAG TPA: peptide-methionine (S)-S-oxide reductase [Bacteroidetes bacterium]|nr:peptide-methionine (S)-S-oxide reductase [Bacteroidota bacterium]